MLKKLCNKFFCKRFYPTNSSDWYKRKGYVGSDDQKIFANFLEKQRLEESIFYKCFKDMKLKRFRVQSGRNFLDCVEIEPTYQKLVATKHPPFSIPIDTKNLPGSGKVFILFQGRGEYYESRYRDMAMLSKATGAKVIGFNPKGFHSSTGKTKTLADIVDDGVALTKYVINSGYDPADIIMLGNSLGGAVQEMVCQRLKSMSDSEEPTKLTLKDISRFRQINSNSFRSLAAVVSIRINASFLEKLLANLLRYSGWEIDVSNSFYEVGLHRMHLRRSQDRTILKGAEYHDKIDIDACIANIPNQYRKDLSWIIMHNQLKPKKDTDQDPHNMSLHNFVVCPIQDIETKQGAKNMSVFELINKYLEVSNHYSKSK